MKWIFVLYIPEIIAALHYASYYQDHMVLQRAPQRAIVWGYGSNIGDNVTVVVSGHEPVHTAIVKYANETIGVWKVKLPPISDPGPYSITTSSPEGVAILKDVMFGDVWMCTGQTDMTFPVSQVMNSTYEIKKAAEFRQVRMFKGLTFQSTKPVDDLTGIDVNWSLPTNASLFNFSAVCWFFGEYLYTHYHQPIGLIQVAFPEASGHTQESIPPIDSGYWNGMIYPLSQMVMYGTIWYQGSGNLENIFNYGYEFTVLMSNIRTLYSSRSLNETKHNMPIGIVQLGPVSEHRYSANAADFRWEQSFDYGVVPNGREPNAFMSVTVDLTDPASPYGPDHPRCKQDVARRLVTGARNIAYGEKDLVFKGPYPDNITFVNNATKWMQIHYTQEIDVRSSSGFQFCCSSTSSEKCYSTDRHIPAPMVSHDSWSVTLSYAGCGSDWLVGLTYAWSGNPCDGYKQCAIYSRKTELPASPYINGWPWYTPPR